MTDDDYCTQRLGGSGSSLYYSHRFLPPRERAWMTALYALAGEIADVGEVCRDPGLAHTKLDWWRQELQRAYDGRPTHPVTRALQPLVQAGLLPEQPLQELIQASTQDIAPVRFATYAVLRQHAQQTAGRIESLAAGLLGGSDFVCQAAAVELGATHALCRQLAGLGADARRNRLYLAAEDLARFDVRETDILGQRESDALRALLSEQAGRLLESYDRALDAVPNPGRAALLPGIVLAAQNRALLEEIRRLRFSVLSQRVALTPLRRLWISWRTQQRERRRINAAR
jgi:phytoene synthase